MESDDTYTAVIAVAEIRPPAKPGRSYSIFTKDGNVFGLWPNKNKLGLLREDNLYEVKVRDNETDSGHTFHNIVGTPKYLGPYRVPKDEPPKDEPSPKPQPPTPANGKAKMDQQYWTPKPRSREEQKQIWICALLAREIEVRGLMTKDELLERAAIHAGVWDEMFSELPIARE